MQTRSLSKGLPIEYIASASRSNHKNMQSNTPKPATLPPPTSVLFARGVIARLSTWPALRLAVENNWGGPNAIEKRTWTASVLVDAFEAADPTPDVQYVEETLLQIMEDEFETVLEDGSALPVAEDIVKLWHAIHVGDLELVQRIEQQAEVLKGKRVVAQQGATNDEDEWESDSGDDDDGDSEEDGDNGETPPLIDRSSTLPQVDEDGFTLVRGKGKSHS